MPPAIDYDPELALRLSEADAALGELSGWGRSLIHPELLIRPYVRREALSSSRIEGTQAVLSDVLFDEVEPNPHPKSDDIREVRNYIDALNHGIERLEILPISGRLIRAMHEKLMDGVRGQERTPGEFRRSQNWLGPPGCTLDQATYVPPPHDYEMMDCLGHWEKFVQVRGQMPDLIQCALMHEHFEAIHPFLDGNGRVGRLLITLFLIDRGRLTKPLLYLSSYIEDHKSEYYECLQGIRTHGEWRRWLMYFLTAVRETARSAVAQGDRIIALRDDYRRTLGANPRALMMLDELFVNPFVTVSRAVAKLNVTAPTATKAIQGLVEAGMLELHDATKSYGRVWVARPILHAVEGTQAKGDTVDTVPD